MHSSVCSLSHIAWLRQHKYEVDCDWLTQILITGCGKGWIKNKHNLQSCWSNHKQCTFSRRTLNFRDAIYIYICPAFWRTFCGQSCPNGALHFDGESLISETEWMPNLTGYWIKMTVKRGHLFYKGEMLWWWLLYWQAFSFAPFLFLQKEITFTFLNNKWLVY